MSSDRDQNGGRLELDRLGERLQYAVSEREAVLTEAQAMQDAPGSQLVRSTLAREWSADARPSDAPRLRSWWPVLAAAASIPLVLWLVPPRPPTIEFGLWWGGETC